MALKIVIIGPESSGKSVLVRQLAKQFQAPHSLEYARAYLTQRKGHYNQSDLTAIAHGQRAANRCPQNASLFFCDTDLLTIIIWSQVKYGQVPTTMLEDWQKDLPDAYLLLAPDLPWAPDPLRESPHLRAQLFDLHLQKIQATKIPFAIIRGLGSQRLQRAIDAIQELQATGRIDSGL
jgi:nicotinamide riboside kinase